MSNIIFAPHRDDEVIGTYEVLVEDSKAIVIFGDVLGEWEFSDILYFPDPIYETHPDHRLMGAQGETLLRAGYNVIFYSINMRAPYIHKAQDPDGKRRMLEEKYPEKRSLWEFDHRYFLFEGYVQWRMSPL